MAEKTNVGRAVFIADITSMCGFGSDGDAALLSAFLVCAQSQLTVEDVFWNATILHTADMT